VRALKEKLPPPRAFSVAARPDARAHREFVEPASGRADWFDFRLSAYHVRRRTIKVFDCRSLTTLDPQVVNVRRSVVSSSGHR